MSKVKRVSQKDNADCAVCCLAMYMGVDYEELLEALPFLVTKTQKGGLYTEQLQMIMAVWSGRPVSIIHNHYDKDREKTKQILKMLDGTPAILSARSLNYPSMGHAVYWDGSKIHDPSNKKKYNKSNISIYEVLF